MSKVTMWRSRWRCVIRPALSVSFLLSINIFVWQNVLYFPNVLLHYLPCCYGAVTGAAWLSLMQYKHFLSISSLFLEEVCTFSRILRHSDVRNFRNVNFFFFWRWMWRRGKAEYPPCFRDLTILDSVNGTNVLKNQEHRGTRDANGSVYRHFTIDNTIN